MHHGSSVISKRRIVWLLVIVVVILMLSCSLLWRKKGVGYVSVRFVVDTHFYPAARHVVVTEQMTNSQWNSNVDNSIATVDVDAMMVSSESLWGTRKCVDLSVFQVSLSDEAGGPVYATCQVTRLLSKQALKDDEISRPLNITVVNSR
jgi:hypothetical protein